MTAPITTFVDGTVNIAGLTVPGAYVDIVLPTPNIVGVPTNIEGLVGVAQWGPVGAPQFISGPADAAIKIGYPVVRTYDMPTYVWAASQVGQVTAGQGAQFACVRVTDGTDVAASVVILSTCLTVTAKYTGTLGNQITITVINGTLANSFAVLVTFPGVAPELFNNITGSGNALWVNIAAAINSGNSTRSASNYVTASAGAGTTAPSIGTVYTLASGTDGATSITTNIMLGQDTLPRKGMYALRSTGIDGFALCDLTDATSWATQTSFAISENCWTALTDAAGDSISTAITNRTSNALDYFYAWFSMGDWPSWFDPKNGYVRQISPQVYQLGLAGNLAPQFSPINKPILGVVQTQKTATKVPWATADLQQANLGGIDLIVGPANSPGGNFFSFATGRNTSSNTAANGLEYTRLTFFLARSFASVAGQFVGLLQSVSPNDPTRQKVTDTFNSFMQSLALPQLGAGGYGLIDPNPPAGGWAQCNLANNPANLQALGYLFCYITVRYLNSVRYFVIKLFGGGNIQVTSQTLPPSPNQFS